MSSLGELWQKNPTHVRMEYWLAFRMGAPLPMLWDLVEREAREIAAMPLEPWEAERRKMEHVERAAMQTIRWLLRQDDPGEARRGLRRPGSHYWMKWIKDGVWRYIGYFRPVTKQGLLDLPAERPLVARRCDSCGEQSVIEDEFDGVSRCMTCETETPHDDLPF